MGRMKSIAIPLLLGVLLAAALFQIIPRPEERGFQPAAEHPLKQFSAGERGKADGAQVYTGYGFPMVVGLSAVVATAVYILSKKIV
jgi:hypothetical protein